jgi:hypothetical protein
MCKNDTIHDDLRRVGEPQLLGKVLRRLVLDLHLQLPERRQPQRHFAICSDAEFPDEANRQGVPPADCGARSSPV